MRREILPAVSDHEPSARERRRRARELEAAMRELDRLDREVGLGAMPSAARRRRRRTPPQLSLVLSLVVTAAMVGTVVALHPSEQMQSLRRTLGIAGSLDTEAVGGAHAFLLTQPGSPEPVGWDPCRPIRWAVNPTDEPVGGREVVENAVERLAASTGLDLQAAGETAHVPFAGATPVHGARPVVIGWGSEEDFPGLEGSIAGLGGARSDGAAGRSYLYTGNIVLDTDVFTAATIARRPVALEAIVLHELGHVVGLGHVDDPDELMAERHSRQDGWGPGDREGLEVLTSIPCR
jgi:hypothetical protein